MGSNQGPLVELVRTMSRRRPLLALRTQCIEWTGDDMKLYCGCGWTGDNWPQAKQHILDVMPYTSPGVHEVTKTPPEIRRPVGPHQKVCPICEQGTEHGHDQDVCYHRALLLRQAVNDAARALERGYAGDEDNDSPGNIAYAILTHALDATSPSSRTEGPDA